MSLERPDQLHLDAASGWLGLGDWKEAQREIECITDSMRNHPEVLAVRWQIHARAKEWGPAVDVGKALASRLPDVPFGWVHQAYALHELKRTEEAWNVLLPVVDKFPREWLLRYNLACYACQLGRLGIALEWLQKAMALAGKEEIKAMALQDPDLGPLQNCIEQI